MLQLFIKNMTCFFGCFCEDWNGRHHEHTRGDSGAVSGAHTPGRGPPAGWPSAPAPLCCTRPGSGTSRRLSPAREAGRWWTWSGSGGVSSSGSRRRTVCRLGPVSPGRPTRPRRCWRNKHLRREGVRVSDDHVEKCFLLSYSDKSMFNNFTFLLYTFFLRISAVETRCVKSKRKWRISQKRWFSWERSKNFIYACIISIAGHVLSLSLHFIWLICSWNLEGNLLSKLSEDGLFFIGVTITFRSASLTRTLSVRL